MLLYSNIKFFIYNRLSLCLLLLFMTISVYFYYSKGYLIEIILIPKINLDSVPYQMS